MGHWTTFCSRLRRRLIVLAMLPVVIAGGQPVVGCICADGRLKTDCPAIRAKACHAETMDGQAPCCAPATQPSCCQGAAGTAVDTSDAQARAGGSAAAPHRCCRPAIEAAVPPQLVAAVRVVDDHHLLALSIVPHDGSVPRAAATAGRWLEDDAARPPTDLVIALGRLLI
jgi:hypothetical protein